MRIAAVGHATWFSNHYPEGWGSDPDVMGLDGPESDFSWLMLLRNWRPDVTVFYRPELYPASYVQHVPGRRIAFLTEPLPDLAQGRMVTTEESALRLAVYRPMAWGAYHHAVFYDPGRRATAEHLGWPVDAYRPLPLDTTHFHPGPPGAARPVDVCFVGKATPHRIRLLDPLRLAPLRFLWVAHGVSGPDLAALFRRCKLVLNIHADGVPALEPRLFLAAACGCRILSEPLSSRPAAFADRIAQSAAPWRVEAVGEELARWSPRWSPSDEASRQGLGVRRMMAEVTGLPVPPPPGAADAPPPLPGL